VEANTTHSHGLGKDVAEQRSSLWWRLTALGTRSRNGAANGRVKLDLAGAKLEHYLRGSDVALLHHRRVAGSRREISHLVIGPAGVTVIDSRHYGGRRARLEDGSIRVGLRNREDLVDAVIAQVAAVRKLLADTPYANTPIEAALARRKVEGVPILQRVDAPRIVVCGTRRIAGEASRPGPLPASQVKALAAYLDGALASR
jgi:hypothetical protein